MRRTLKLTAVAWVGVGLALIGCSDAGAPTEPDVHAAGQAVRPFFSYAPASGFDVLLRSSVLATEVSRTEVIGNGGGTIRIPAAGVTLDVPPGALSSDTEITVTALAGYAVAFQFAPHGLQFDVPASVRVDAEYTEAFGRLWRLLGDDGDGEDEDDWSTDPDYDDDIAYRGEGGWHERRPLDSFIGVYFQGDPAAGVDPLENIGAYLNEGDIVFDINHFSGYACAEG